MIHPLIVHFPIALLTIGVALRLIHYFLRKSRFSQATLFSAWVLLFLGVGFAWIAVIAGEAAEDIVGSTLCEPQILERHKHLAYSTAALFSFAYLLDLGKAWLQKPMLLLTIALSILYTAAAGTLLFTGGYGSNLVFEQGAAVAKECH